VEILLLDSYALKFGIARENIYLFSLMVGRREGD